MIILKSSEELSTMREAGRIAAQILSTLGTELRVGVGLAEIDQLARELCTKFKVRPAFLGYQDFPAAVCISMNDEVVHGIPKKDRHINDGDLVSLDFGVELNGFYSDTARTWLVGEDKDLMEKQRLISVTEQALKKGISKAIVGNRIFDISHSIQTEVESEGFGIVREYVGHGIGRRLHEDPQIPNFGPPAKGPILRVGMVLAIEPMVTYGKHSVFTDRDGWTVKTKDQSWAAHFEHTVAITPEGPEIFTTY